MGGLLTGNLCSTYFWSDLHSVCILYLSRLSIYLYFFGINCMIKCFMKNRIVYYPSRLHVISTYCICINVNVPSFFPVVYIPWTVSFCLHLFANLKFEVVHIFLSLPYLL